MAFFGKLFSKKKKETLDQGLQKTKESVWGKITRAIGGKDKVDDDVLDSLEEAFITFFTLVSSFINPTLLWSRPAVSIITTSAL